jgi:hypothetical protein
MLLEMVKNEGVQIEIEGIGFAASRAVTRLMRSIQESPDNAELLERASVLLSILKISALPVNYWEAQNIYYSMLQKDYLRVNSSAGPAAQRRLKNFISLGEKLQVAVPAPVETKELQVAS